MRLIDTDVLIEDLEFDIELNQRALDNGDIDHSTREIMQFDKDCKQNAVSLLREAPTVEAIPIEWILLYIQEYPYMTASSMLHYWSLDQAIERKEE